MQKYIADLHVHTLLSPCAEIEMTPHNIIVNALEQGINIIAITDHNSCDNIPAAIQAASETGITVIPGMEVETKEEIHIVALFHKVRQLASFAKFIDSRHSGAKNVPEKFGPQFVVTADDELVREKTEMLLCPISASLSEVVENIHLHGGIAIAAHIDRPANGILSLLGFIPPDLNIDAIEVSSRIKITDAIQKYKKIGKPILTSSDAHFMDALHNGAKTQFLLEQPTLEEIVKALNSQDGRMVIVEKD